MFGPSGVVCCFAREAVRGAIVSSAFHFGENGGYPPTKNGDIRSLLCA